MPEPLTLARRRYVRRRLLARRAVLGVRQAWKAVDPAYVWLSWQSVAAPKVFDVIAGAQYEAASSADATTAQLLMAQGVDATSAAMLSPAAFAGVASDGRSLSTLIDLAAQQALQALRAGAPAPDALNVGGRFLELVAGLQVTDAGRVADGVAVTTRRAVTGYYRLLSPPSCARCAILAGRWYRWDAGFERHPRCDCISIPGDDGSLDDDPRLWSPRDYFDSLTEVEQDRVFTAAGAQAIRDGADMSQIVNARSGMQTASVGGRDVLTTSYGTTKRGYFAYVQRAMDELRATDTDYATTATGRRGYIGNYKTRRVVKPRLMPEEIYRLAGGDREEAIRLLAGNGYLVQGVQHDAARALAH